MTQRPNDPSKLLILKYYEPMELPIRNLTAGRLLPPKFYENLHHDQRLWQLSNLARWIKRGRKMNNPVSGWIYGGLRGALQAAMAIIGVRQTFEWLSSFSDDRSHITFNKDYANILNELESELLHSIVHSCSVSSAFIPSGDRFTSWPASRVEWHNCIGQSGLIDWKQLQSTTTLDETKSESDDATPGVLDESGSD